MDVLGVFCGGKLQMDVLGVFCALGGGDGAFFTRHASRFGPPGVAAWATPLLFEARRSYK